MDQLTIAQQFTVWVLPVLFAITLHEVAHGWLASKLGDPTALLLGRISLNPLKHIDPVGTVLIPGIMLALGGFLFGWAKPVPVNWNNLRHPKRDQALVAAAGPLSNLFMALIWAAIAKLALIIGNQSQNITLLMFYMGRAGVMINISLMLINFIPIPPLDGGRVLASLLPMSAMYQFNKIEPFGFLILLALLTTGLLNIILNPLMVLFQVLIMSLFGL